MYLYEERYCAVSCFRESKQEINSISCVFQVRESQLKGMQVYPEYKNYVLICIQRLNIKAIKVKIDLKSHFQAGYCLYIRNYFDGRGRNRDKTGGFHGRRMVEILEKGARSFGCDDTPR